MQVDVIVPSRQDETSLRGSEVKVMFVLVQHSYDTPSIQQLAYGVPRMLLTLSSSER